MTERKLSKLQELRFRNNVEALPQMCATVHPSEGGLIVIFRGAEGFKRPLNGPPADMPASELRAEVDRMNKAAGVTRAQEAAMVAGSMHGFWSVLADPTRYDDQGREIK